MYDFQANLPFYAHDIQVAGSSSHRQLAPGLSHQPAKATWHMAVPEMDHALEAPYKCLKGMKWKYHGLTWTHVWNKSHVFFLDSYE